MEVASTEHRVEPVADRPRYRVASCLLLGFAILVTGVWAGIVPFVGPKFGFTIDAGSAWQWSLTHALLYVVPGAVAVVAGLMTLSMVGALRSGAARATVGWLALLTVLAGIWLVLGPTAWAAIHHGPERAGLSPSAVDRFVTLLGYNLGPGLLLAIFGSALIGLLPERIKLMTRGRAVAAPVQERPAA